MDLLEKMLAFHPGRRYTVDQVPGEAFALPAGRAALTAPCRPQCLAHPYLKSLHDPRREPTCPVPFDFSFEKVTMTKPVIQG
jgi:hypothetical protein